MAERALYSIVVLVIFCAVSSNEAQAFEISSLFKNSEQKAQSEFEQSNFSAAAELFIDPYRKGVALYRSGQYAAAEQQFNSVQRPSIKTAAMYNAGNAQMQQKKWRAAINNYEEVLKVEPDHADALFNLELAKKMLAENKDQTDNKSDSKSEDKSSSQPDADKANPQADKNDPQNKQDNKSPPNQNQNPNQPPPPPPPSSTPSSFGDIDDPISQAAPPQSEQDAKAEQWLNRINSDIRIFLRNKFYIEDRLSSK